jgi:hypothetical protein
MVDHNSNMPAHLARHQITVVVMMCIMDSRLGLRSLGMCISLEDTNDLREEMNGEDEHCEYDETKWEMGSWRMVWDLLGALVMMYM